MNDLIEPLESRVLLSTSYAAAGTYDGPATPVGHTSQTAFIAAIGNKKSGSKLNADLVLNIASNDIVTGTLALSYGKTTQTTVGSYVLSGLVVGADVDVTIESTGHAVGTFSGTLKALNKKLKGPFSTVLNGQAVTGKLTLINAASKSTKTGKATRSVALAPGYYPNLTPPPIASGTGTSPGNQTGITGGDNSGTGLISDGGSILG
jgi:hypothetical protein